MALYLLLLVLVLILGAFGLRWFLVQPVKYRRLVGDDFSKFFQSLLSPVYETGVLIFEPDRKRFVQFCRYGSNREAGVQCDFPLAPWSRQYYDLLKGILDERRIDYETVPTG